MDSERGRYYPMVSDVPGSPVQLCLDRLPWRAWRPRRYVLSQVSPLGERVVSGRFASRTWAQVAFLRRLSALCLAPNVWVEPGQWDRMIRRGADRRQGMTVDEVIEHVRTQG